MTETGVLQISYLHRLTIIMELYPCSCPGILESPFPSSHIKEYGVHNEPMDDTLSTIRSPTYISFLLFCQFQGLEYLERRTPTLPFITSFFRLFIILKSSVIHRTSFYFVSLSFLSLPFPSYT